MQIARTLIVVASLVGTAHAPFVLQAPASYDQIDSSGMPEKSAPCGQADAGYPVVATNAVTTVEQSGQLTIMVDEVVFHPGHYRVAIAPDMNSLPADPATNSLCSTVAVESSPMLPVIA